MDEAFWADFWWRRVAGPNEFMRRIVSCLREGRSVILRVPRNLPWHQQLMALVKEQLQEASGTEALTLSPVEPGSEGMLWSAQTVTKCLVDRFALPDDRLRYRPSPGGDQSFLMRKGILRNKVIWVSGLDREGVEAWASLCEGWRAQTPTEGLFVIEDDTAATQCKVGTKNLAEIDYSRLVSDYSAQLFNGFVLDDSYFSRLTTIRKRYTATLMTQLCQQDVEMSYMLVSENDLRRDCPQDAMRSLVRSQRIDKRITLNLSDDMVSIGSKWEHELDRQVWSAQLEVLFPLIEDERLRIVNCLREQLDSLIRVDAIVQHDERVTTVEDVELGSLVHLMGRAPDGSRHLIVPDETLRSRIFLLRKCRNNLAHHNCCSPIEVSELLRDA